MYPRYTVTRGLLYFKSNFFFFSGVADFVLLDGQRMDQKGLNSGGSLFYFFLTGGFLGWFSR